MINQYVGVNAHLNDQLVTTPFAWESFHTHLMVSMASHMDNWLFESGMNYTADLIPSIQIRTPNDYDDPGSIMRPEPDIAIYKDDQQPAKPTSPSLQPNAPTAQMTIPQSLGISEHQFRAIAIRQIEERSGAPGEMAAWIEILSPTNKQAVAGRPGWGRHADVYTRKREALITGNKKSTLTDEEAMLTGNKKITLVELDFLQAQPPVVKGLPRYQRGPAGEPSEPGASAFYAAVSDPRPRTGWLDGRTELYEFGIEQSLPTVAIPLLGSDIFTCPLQPSYDHVLSDRYARRLDYSNYPALWDTYKPDDQDRIAARMDTIEIGMKSQLISASQKEPLPLAVPIPGARFRLAKRLDRANGRQRPGMEIDR